MKGNEMLDLIGDVKGSYVMEAQSHREEKKTKRRSPVKIVLAAAVIASLLAGCTYAVMKLQDLKIGEYTPEALPTETQSAEYSAPKARDMISLQGFAGSPGFQATKEWLDYEEAYDSNGELATAADNAGFVPPVEYMAYNCYTQEMMDKVDEICQKYNLKPLGQLWMEQMNMQAVFDLLGIDGITSGQGEHKLLGGYYYEGGTFQVDGVATLSGWNQPVSYSFRSVMKDTLDYVSLVVGRIEDYTQWNYTTKDGTEVLLALSPQKALILADMETYFASVNVLNFGEDWENMSSGALEALADSFDFNYQPHTVDPAAAKARQEAEEAEFMAEQAKLAANAEEWYNQTYRKTSYAEFVKGFKGEYMYQGAEYAITDVNDDGVEDLVLRKDETLSYGSGTDMKTCKCKNSMVLTMKTDGLTDRLWEGACDLYENGVFGDFVTFNGDYSGYWTWNYFRLVGNDGGFHKFVDTSRCDRVGYSPDNGGSWSRIQDGSIATITEEEAMEIIASYKPADLDWKPITEFPMN